ncbi:hypothetical protein XELAEV_18011555mg [Xenopus laevis]|uniref:Uncharacterized protein n=1 Tax=Xenopus laevis TaxID=8355 RepID=A0A974DL35_XENLA|nr:hypothetical protein XELAEV_18011555mg [Xenopus laevis]
MCYNRHCDTSREQHNIFSCKPGDGKVTMMYAFVFPELQKCDFSCEIQNKSIIKGAAEMVIDGSVRGGWHDAWLQ